jgi:hypothetical protein
MSNKGSDKAWSARRGHGSASKGDAGFCGGASQHLAAGARKSAGGVERAVVEKAECPANWRQRGQSGSPVAQVAPWPIATSVASGGGAGGRGGSGGGMVGREVERGHSRGLFRSRDGERTVQGVDICGVALEHKLEKVLWSESGASKGACWMTYQMGVLVTF